MRPTVRTAALAVALAGLWQAAPAHAQVELTSTNCSSSAPTTGHVRWPDATAPIWEFDIVRPGATGVGATPSGTGLEIRDVYYRGRKVMERGNVPVLNVEYDPGGGCSCFRDWEDSEVRFQATGTVVGATCLAVSTPGSVVTTCERNMAGGQGGDTGSFNGVAFEDYGTELVLTSHMQAGWYRYRMRWHFYADGRIWPEYSYSAASATCTSAAHRHHAYWRFDFDIDGTPNDDVMTERTAAGTTTTFTNEASRTWGAASSGTFWAVRDGATGAGYDVVPSAQDLLLPIDAFSKTDALILRYKATELYDNGGGCAIDYAAEMNNESLTDQDVVMWYRSSALHTGGNPWECDIVGPSLNPVGFAVANEAPPMGAAAVEIDAAVPNPFSPSTSVRFRVAESQNVRVLLYDALGRQVSVLFEGPAEGGRQETVTVDGSSLPAGTYVVRVEGERAAGTTRIVLAR